MSKESRVDTYEQRLAAWEAELREKYSDKDREALAKKGHAMPDGSYPIEDGEDLDNAIHAVGRGGSDHNAIRKHIISAAKRLGQSDKIPDNWQADGSLKQSNSRRKKERHRAVPLSREVRYFRAGDLEVRAMDDTDEITIRGSAIVYGAAYRVVDMFGEFEERIHHGAVGDLLTRGVDCRFLFNHDGMPLARTTSGTLDLVDTPRSLDIIARLDARQQIANDLYVAIQRGDVDQMSVGMIVASDQWGDDGNTETRDIYGLSELLDVSAVTYPCSPTTHIEVAQRMMMDRPVESVARVRRLYQETRAGKVLSAANAAHLQNAHEALGAVLEAGGYGQQNDGDADDVGAPTVVQHPAEGESPLGDDLSQADGTVTSGMSGGEGGVPGGYADASGTRSDDTDVETRAEDAELEDGVETGDGVSEDEEKASRARALRIQAELRRRRRQAA